MASFSAAFGGANEMAKWGGQKEIVRSGEPHGSWMFLGFDGLHFSQLIKVIKPGCFEGGRVPLFGSAARSFWGVNAEHAGFDDVSPSVDCIGQRRKDNLMGRKLV